MSFRHDTVRGAALPRARRSRRWRCVSTHRRCKLVHEPKRLARAVALYLFVVVALFVLTWIKDIIPALLNQTRPAILAKTAQLTNLVEVLDLSLLLPLAVLGGFWLWRRHPWGGMLAGAVRTTLTLVGVSVVIDMTFEHSVNPMMSLAVAVTLIGFLLLAAHLCILPHKSRCAPRGRESLDDA